MNAPIIITDDDLDRLGNVDKVLIQFYEENLQQIIQQYGLTEQTVRDWFHRELITEAETRGLVHQGPQETGGLPNEAVKVLADRFLLRAEVRAGGIWYELVHDRFVDPILQSNETWYAAQQAKREQRFKRGLSIGGLILTLLVLAGVYYWFIIPATTEELAQQYEAEFNRLTDEEERPARLTALYNLVTLGAAYHPRAEQLLRPLPLAERQALWASGHPPVVEAISQPMAQIYQQQITAGQERLKNLANLLALPGYEPQAVALFDDLAPADQLALFADVPESLLPELKLVVEETYARSQYLDTELLTAMQGAFEQDQIALEVYNWAEARRNWQEEDYPEAKQFYDVAIRTNPHNPATWLERAELQTYFGLAEEALADLNQAYALDPSRETEIVRIIHLAPVLYQLAYTATFREILSDPHELAGHYLVTETDQTDQTELSGFENLTALGLENLTALGLMPMVTVPAGPFMMGSDDGFDDEEPIHEVELDEYQIDLYEVTNYQYGLCVVAEVCEAPRDFSSADRDHYYGNPIYNNYPVIYVTWFQAQTYCDWRGARLPTEAEWEKAARGTDGRVYPWGDRFEGTKLNFCDTHCTFDWADADYDDGYADTAPVGSYPDGVSPYGVHDMAGNVWEWTMSAYQDYPYKNDDKNDTNKNVSRVLRGGSWFNGDIDVRAAVRSGNDPVNHYSFVGFRCALSP